jgi:hypothetical protein
MVMHVYDNILVPYDGSQSSHLAVQHAFTHKDECTTHDNKKTPPAERFDGNNTLVKDCIGALYPVHLITKIQEPILTR